jgi:hypothetical protein
MSMPDVSLPMLFSSLALGIALAASAGLRAWLPLLATGLLARFDIVRLGDSFDALSSTPALILFGTATVVELLGDKIPWADHALDAVSTFIRPAAGVLLSASVMWQITDPVHALALGLVVGAPAAAVPHVLKSGVRVASTATTGGLLNPLVSLIEDAIALAMVVLAVVVPVVAAIVVSFLAIWGVRRATRLMQQRAAPTAAT